MKSIFQIDMANLSFTRFAKAEVLSSKEQIAERQHLLLRAMLLNYGEHQPVNIYFKTNQDKLLGIECAVIAVTDDHVMLNSGFIIPVQSILLIELL